MKNNNTHNRFDSAGRSSKLLYIFYALLTFLVLGAGTAYAQYGFNGQDAAVDVQIQGPIHEAYADISVHKLLPLAPTTQRVPEPINELPAENRPVGELVEWISGYWSWDENLEDFIWVSGIWRQVPPEREWRPGYWTWTNEGNQYVPGYWAQLNQSATEYLPAPPEPLYAGSSSPQDSADYEWMQGHWVWSYDSYVWQAGYWYSPHPDMVWTPAHYVWTPRGYIFVSGYWDYQLSRRGELYAPVHFTRPIYRDYDYYYIPRIALDFDTVFLSLFIRRGFPHYYFGNFDHADYRKRGFHPWYDRKATKYGYDHQYRSYRSHSMRHDRKWERKYHREFQQHRQNNKARVKVNYPKKHNLKQTFRKTKPSSGKHIVKSPENRRQAIQSHKQREYQKGKVRVHDQKIKRRTAGQKGFERLPASDIRSGKKTITKKYVQKNKAAVSMKRLKNKSGERRHLKQAQTRYQPPKVKQPKSARKQQLLVQGQEAKSLTMQRKKDRRVTTQQKNLRNVNNIKSFRSN